MGIFQVHIVEGVWKTCEVFSRKFLANHRHKI